MATAQLSVSMWASEVGDLVLTYDTTSLVVQSVTYENRAARPATVEVYRNGGLVASRTIPAQTPPTTIDISALGILVSQATGQPVLPAGWSLSVRLPTA